MADRAALAAGNASSLSPPVGAAHRIDARRHRARRRPARRRVQRRAGDRRGSRRRAHGHPGVDRIAFTGSDPTGKLVAQAAAANLTPTSLELGGKSPFVAFADADLDAVVKQAVNQFDNAGQVCLAGTRLIVERSMHDAFLERFLEAAAAIRQGDPRDETTDIGPQITGSTSSAWTGSCSARRPTARSSLLGGGPNDDLGGLYYRPTLFADVPEGAEVLRKEVFGPVLTLQTFDDEDEAIALANETDYGLAAIVYTGDRERAERVSERAGRGHGLGEQLLRARPSGPLRRREVLRCRPRGRRLQPRLLRGRQERLHGSLASRS